MLLNIVCLILGSSTFVLLHIIREKGYIEIPFIGYLPGKDRPRFFDQVGHQTTNASIGNKHFFTK